MRSSSFFLFLLLIAAAGCNKTVKPVRNPAPPKGAVFHPWGIIGAQTISDNYSGTLIIKTILKGSPADKAGLLKDDRIATIDGIDAPELDVSRYIQCKSPGDTVVFRLQRNTTYMNISIRVGEYPPLDQIALMCYHASVAADYVRAHELLRTLKKRDTTGNRKTEIAKLEQKLQGLETIPDARQDFDSLLLLARKAALFAMDKYRALQILSILEKRNRTADETAKLEQLKKLVTENKKRKKT